MKTFLNKRTINKFGLAILFALIFSSSNVLGQEGIKLNSPEAFKGYTLCNADRASATYLIDNCGKIVNTWTGTAPRHYCRLTNEGNLIFISGNMVIERDWNNNEVRTITLNTADLLFDYEVIKLENGNYLTVARRIVDREYFDLIGWNPEDIVPDRVDCIIEFDVNGDVVWEWNIADHTIQDDYAGLTNFGVIKDHPERVNVHAISQYDWQFGESFMINGFDYNPELDQILISVRKMSEYMIIDHSTTTAEAKGSTGGNSGKGGDILYRWGNPQNYGQGSEDDRVLYYQHNPNWIKYGEHKGKVIVYNNGLNRFIPGEGTFSSVHIVNTPLQSDGNYTLENNEAYAPAFADVTIDKQVTGTSFYSGYTSGAQVLPNGNIYITVGRSSDFLEVKTDGTLVWDYTLAFSYYIFRTERYAPEFPGFIGKDLSASGTIEEPSSSYACNLFTSTEDEANLNLFKYRFDQSNKNLIVENIGLAENILEIRNLQGQLVESATNARAGTILNFNHSPLGLYFITFYELESQKTITHKLMNF